MTGHRHPPLQDRRVPVERLLRGDLVQAVPNGPVGTVETHSNGWTVVSYPRHSRGWGLMKNRSTVPYQHGIDRVILVSSPPRHDIRHPGSAMRCVYCWADAVGTGQPLRYKAIVPKRWLDPGDTVRITVSVENATGERQLVSGVEYGPMRLVTEEEEAT